MGKIINGKLELVYQDRDENECNWKLMGRSFLENLSILDEIDSYEKHDGESNQAPMQTIKSVSLNKNYEMPDCKLPVLEGIPDKAKHKAHLVWYFPNLLLIQMPNYLYSIILQPTGIGLTLSRINLFINETAGVKHVDPNLQFLSSKWLKEYKKSGLRGEQFQQDLKKMTNSAHKFPLKVTQKENCPHGYDFQRFLVDSILANHEYYWSAPLYNGHGR